MTVVLQRQSTRPVNDLPILLTEDQELPHGVPRDLSSGRIDRPFLHWVGQMPTAGGSQIGIWSGTQDSCVHLLDGGLTP